MGNKWTETDEEHDTEVCAHGSAGMMKAGVPETVRRFAPASLISVHSAECVKLCKTHFACSGPVACVIVKETEEKAQLFFAHQGCLQAVLSDAVNRHFLVRLGYPEQGTADQYVRILIQRMRGMPFPHEAGLFFGYPMKDVCGFMGAPIRYRKTMGWRMYGDTHISEMIYARYKNARSLVRGMLQAYMEK